MGEVNICSPVVNQYFVSEENPATSLWFSVGQAFSSISNFFAPLNIYASRYVNTKEMPRMVPGENFFSHPTRMGFRSITLGAEAFKISLSATPLIVTVAVAPESVPLFAVASGGPLGCGLRVSVEIDHDEDNDGFPSNGKLPDCNDYNSAIHPEAKEICNGVDDNCDGSIDEDVQKTYYQDADGDQYGNPAVSLKACEAPKGYAENHDDCDDANPAVHPRAEEVCNYKDDNCEGSVDEGVQSIFYQDMDEDHYGNPELRLQACEVPQGYVANSQDCDDLNSNTYPGALEICNRVDDNCDGNIDEEVQSTFYQDTDADQYGNPSIILKACEAPRGYVPDNTDCNDTNPTIHPHAVDQPDGIDRNCDGQFIRSYSVQCGNDYQSIQELIDIVPPETEIEICEGTYTEHLHIGKSVHFRGRGNVIFDGSNFNCNPSILGDCDNFVFSYFIYAYGNAANLSFNNIQFRNGGSIAIPNDIHLSISDCSFRNNPWGESISGTQSLIFNFNSDPMIGFFSLSNTEFSDNQCYICLSLPKMSMNIDNVTVRNNTFVEMLSTDYSDHSVTINHSRFENNILTLPITANPYLSGVLGLAGTPSSTALIQNSVFSGNHSLLASAINVFGGQVTAMDCTFDGNVVDTSGTDYDSNYAAAVLMQFIAPPAPNEGSFTSIRSQWNNNSPHDVGITNQVFDGPRGSTSYHFDTNGSADFTCSTNARQCIPQ